MHKMLVVTRLFLVSMIPLLLLLLGMSSLTTTLAFLPTRVVTTPSVVVFPARHGRSSVMKSTTQRYISTSSTSSTTMLRYQVLSTNEETMVHTHNDHNNSKDKNSKNSNDAVPPTHIRSTTVPPTLGDIRKWLPKSVFQVDTPTSLLYFALDFMAVVTGLTALHAVVTSSFYHTLPWYAQAMTVLPLQCATGFTMWCMWCIGHDAGHTTISKHARYGSLINRVVGEVAHSMVCLTPFIPWKKSHLQHHLHHNHLEKDYSHQWFVREESHHLHPLIQWSYKTRNLQLPVLYLVYLLFGVPDGGHVYFYGRLWEKESMAEKLKASVSVVVSVGTAATLWSTLGTADFIVVCMVPWLVLSLWLFTVTYLQHHSEDGKLYTDDTWTFTKGAFETVDRDYGTLVNNLSHNMMNGHVIHHLFFTRVPHYHLKEATDALVVGMRANGQEHLYKQIETHNFGYEIVKQFNENWFFCDEAQVVRK